MSTLTNLITVKNNAGVETHPEYDKMYPRWCRIEDALLDEEQIKDKGSLYLPVPSGLLDLPPNIMQEVYYAYCHRAVWYSYPRTTIGDLIGMITKKPYDFEVPKGLEGLLLNASLDYDPIEIVKNRVLEHQLSYSRYGVLLDIPNGSEGLDVIPQMLEYGPTSILNWASDYVKGKKIMVALVLDESYEEVGEGFVREEKKSFRICALTNIKSGNPIYYTYVTDAVGVKAFRVGQEIPENGIIPMIRSKTLDYIPFQIFNAISLEMETDIPVLMQLVDISFAIYRGEADYRHTLFMQGQGTPYAIGVNPTNDKVSLGAGSFIEITNEKAKVGFLEITGTGVDAQEKALTNLHKLAKESGIGLQEAGAQQSGEALGIRVGIKTASLTGIVRVNAKGFENLLIWAAEWMGLPSDTIKVTPNVDFAQNIKTTKELLDITAVAEKGYCRLEDVYNFQVKNDYTSALTFEDWKNDLENSGLTTLNLSGLGLDEDFGKNIEEDLINEEE